MLYSPSFIAFLLKNWSVVGIYSIMMVLLLLFLIDYEFDLLLLYFISTDLEGMNFTSLFLMVPLEMLYVCT